ncbi:MAG: M48 family metalloprotease [Hyphomicrobiales bacterium]
MPLTFTNWALRRLTALVAAIAVFLASLPVPASAQNLPLIRDAEIEGLMRLYTRDIFRAAGLSPGAVDVYLINNPAINAFVAGGQRIFIYTGLLQQADTPNEVIGVLAHETGHIAGGHLSRMNNEMAKASNMAIIGMLLGAAAMVGGGLAGSPEAARGGMGAVLGGQSMAQRTMLAYARAQEASADQAAVKFLDKTGQSGKGMLDLFETLATQSLASSRYVNPYVLTHPMPLDRIRNLEDIVTKSPNYNKVDPPALVLRHKLMQAKLNGFLNSAQVVYQKYPPSDQSLPARYARAIASMKVGDLQNALPAIDGLIKEIPNNPYFWELKGQALVEGGRPAEAIAPLKQAMKLLPNSGLIALLLAQAQVGSDSPQGAQDALETLRVAQRTEGDAPMVWTLSAQAYGKLGQIPRAELATAQAALLRGDRQLAMTKAKTALAAFPQNSPEWLKANDILTFAKRSTDEE